MPIRFYTTSVSAEKTAREMQKILAQSDARRVAMDYDAQGRPTAIQFVLQLANQPLPFRIEPDIRGMKKALNEDEDTPGDFDIKQARRVAWRIWKEWMNSVLAFRKTRQAHLDQLLLGFGLTQDGRTVHERLLDERKLLDAPSE
jgi:hypothetical protein